MKVALDQIKVGDRYRKDMGDLDGLTASMSERGQIQPIALWPDYTLACGARRLAAARQLGWSEIDAVILRGPGDLLARILTERDENTCREGFAPSEWVSLGKELERLEGAAARERGEAGHNQHTEPSGRFPKSLTGQTRDKVAAAFGVSGKTYEKAKKVVAAAMEDPGTFAGIAQEMDETANIEGAFRKMQRAQRKKDAPPAPAPAVIVSAADLWRVDHADCLDWFAAQEEDSIDLVFGSPPYEDARTYLEDGEDKGIARKTDAWVAWMADVYVAALRCCKGLVAFVVEGRTKRYRWSVSPASLMHELHRRGIHVRKPPIYHRVGIPGSGGPDWLRNDYEFIVCATRPGQLPWSDNTAMGKPPVYEPGGEISHRQQDGRRVNQVGKASMKDRNNLGPHRARWQAGRTYSPPEIANPGNVIACKVGGGNMGGSLCHENEAPFPESLAEFFVRSFCPPGGIVCDPFSGSGTTAKVSIAWGRRFRGCDVRLSQVELGRQRLAAVQQEMFKEPV